MLCRSQSVFVVSINCVFVVWARLFNKAATATAMYACLKIASLLVRATSTPSVFAVHEDHNTLRVGVEGKSPTLTAAISSDNAYSKPILFAAKPAERDNLVKNDGVVTELLHIVA